MPKDKAETAWQQTNSVATQRKSTIGRHGQPMATSQWRQATTDQSACTNMAPQHAKGTAHNTFSATRAGPSDAIHDTNTVETTFSHTMVHHCDEKYNKHSRCKEESLTKVATNAEQARHSGTFTRGQHLRVRLSTGPKVMHIIDMVCSDETGEKSRTTTNWITRSQQPMSGDLLINASTQPPMVAKGNCKWNTHETEGTDATRTTASSNNTRAWLISVLHQPSLEPPILTVLPLMPFINHWCGCCFMLFVLCENAVCIHNTCRCLCSGVAHD